MLSSWKTTLAGIIGILITALPTVQNWLQGQPVSWTPVLGALAAGIGLIFARDNNVTSEQANAAPAATTTTATITQAAATVTQAPAAVK